MLVVHAHERAFQAADPEVVAGREQRRVVLVLARLHRERHERHQVVLGRRVAECYGGGGVEREHLAVEGGLEPRYAAIGAECGVQCGADVGGIADAPGSLGAVSLEHPANGRDIRCAAKTRVGCGRNLVCSLEAREGQAHRPHDVVLLELLVEQVAGELDERGVVLLRAEGRRRREVVEPALLRADHAVAQPAQQHRDLGAIGAVVDVGLVERDEPPVRAGVAVEEGRVGGPEQQVFEHREVGHEDVRRPLAHLLAAEQFVGQPGHAREQSVVDVLRLAPRLLRVADVAAERDLGVGGEERPEPAHLVVRERVHRVEQQRPYTRLAEGARGGFLEQALDRGEQDALGLARAGPSRDQEVPPVEGLPDRGLLVLVERALLGERVRGQEAEPLRQHALIDQRAE